MKKNYYCLYVSVLLVIATTVSAQQVVLQVKRPLSKEDKQEVEQILSNFDPSTYKFSSKYQDENGKAKNFNLGKAKGLASVRVTNSRLGTNTVDGAAGTV